MFEIVGHVEQQRSDIVAINTKMTQLQQQLEQHVNSITRTMQPASNSGSVHHQTQGTTNETVPKSSTAHTTSNMTTQQAQKNREVS